MEENIEKIGVIIAAGDFPSHVMPLSLLEKYRSHIICCDGAADELLAKGFMPEMVIGDGDSISAEARIRLSDRIVFQSEQDTNDLTKAVHYSVSHDFTKLFIVGATGKREDHTLGNISLLSDYMDIVNVEMWTDYGRFVPVTGEVVFDTFKGQQLSFFCMDSSPITLQNVRWPLENHVITRWWQATLNESLYSKFVVKTIGKVVVFIEYPK